MVTSSPTNGATSSDGWSVTHRCSASNGCLARYIYSLTVRDPFGAASTGSATLTIVGAAPPYADIVLHAADATAVRGTWRRVRNLAAASGIRLHQPDAGAARLNAPLARPSNYFELRFKANPALVYQLWIRARADRNAWQNDSVFLQFSGAIGADGSRQWHIGSTSALLYRLERCTSCGLDGWGWNTDGFVELSNVGTPLRFNDDAWQTLRIQQREDGVSIDQIVLSSVTYLGDLAPGDRHAGRHRSAENAMRARAVAVASLTSGAAHETSRTSRCSSGRLRSLGC